MALLEALGGFAAPCYAEGGFEDVGGDLCETYPRGAFFAPAARDRGEDFRGVLNHTGLLVGGEEQDAEALMFEGEGGEDFAGDAEVGIAEVRAFRGFGQREGDAAEGCWFHVVNFERAGKFSRFGRREANSILQRKTARQASSVICRKTPRASLEFIAHLID